MNRWLASILLAAPLGSSAACTSSDGTPMTAGDSGAADTAVCNGVDSIPAPPPPMIRGPALGQREGEAPGNLVINQARMRTSVQIQYRTFTASSCEVMEGCTMPGRRRLLRFDLETPNNGEGDVYLGAPNRVNRDNPVFEFATCHRHYHFLGYADYRMYDNCGREVGRGHKQSFCLEDSRRTGNIATAGMSARYHCGDQGIQSGWSDVYGRHLDCQYVDITDVPPGTYLLQARINIDRGVAESNYDDNRAVVEVTVPPPTEPTDGGMTVSDPLAVCATDEEGINRDCGWTMEGTHTCTPGAMVTVGCDSGCMPALGSCMDDPMIRICAGNRPCQGAMALTANDDNTNPAAGTVCPGRMSNTCPVTRFMCPTGGQYTVLTGSYRSGAPSICVVAAQ